MPESFAKKTPNFVALPEWTVYVFINPFIIRTHYLYGYYPFIWKLINMTVQDYLLKFRKINSLESLEKLFDHLNYTLSDNQDIINMYRAADHRRAELVSGGRLFNVGEVPKSVWRYVV